MTIRFDSSGEAEPESAGPVKLSRAGMMSRKCFARRKSPGLLALMRGRMAAMHEEPPKPDKKRILIKKKREEGAEDSVAPLGSGRSGVCKRLSCCSRRERTWPSLRQSWSDAEVIEAVQSEPAPSQESVPQPSVVTASAESAAKSVQAPSMVTPSRSMRSLRRRRRVWPRRRWKAKRLRARN